MSYPYLLAQLDILPNKTRGKITLILMRVMMGLTATFLVLNIILFWIYSTHRPFPPHTVELMDTLRLLFFIPSLLLIVFFMLWTTRALKNLHKASVEQPEFTYGWAYAGWFVPFLNLIRPYQVMKEIWNKTQEAFRDEAVLERRKDALIGYWWIAYLASLAFAYYTSYIAKSFQFEIAYVCAIIANSLSLLALLAGGKMVRIISEMEEEMRARATAKYEAEVALSAEHYLESNSTGNNVAFSPAENPPVKFELIGDFTENAQRAKFVIAGLYLLILVCFLYGGVNYYVLTEAGDASFSNLLKAAKILQQMYVGGFFACCATVVALMLWMKRAYENLYSLDIKALAFKPDAAIYAWFIPVGNIFIPFLLLSEINTATKAALDPEKKTGSGHPGSFMLLSFFWVLLVISSLMLLQAFIGSARILAVAGIICAVTGMIAFYLGTVLVKNISQLETELFARVEKASEAEELIINAAQINNAPGGD